MNRRFTTLNLPSRFSSVLYDEYGAIRKAVCKIGALLSAMLLGALLAIPATYADDTEIFFGKAGTGAESNPNVLFILDTSGSMRQRDGSSQSRMDRMKTSMNALLDQSSSFNVGLMGFNGNQGGGTVRYPVGYLEEDRSTSCPEEGCPPQRVVGRGIAAGDDAYENTASGQVTTNADSTPMGILESEPVASTTTTGDETTETVTATESVAEAFHIASEQARHKTDGAADLLFYWGTADTHEKPVYAYRFDDIDVPVGATVTSANITFTALDSARQVGQMGMYLSAEARSNPTPYPAPGAPDPDGLLSLRSLTNALVAWSDVPAELGGAQVVTPDISGLLQEVISLPQWQRGNALSIHLESFDEVAAGLETVRQFHGVTSDASVRPMLTYTYTESGDVESGITTLEATSHSLEHYNPNILDTSQDLGSAEVDLFFKDINHEPGQLGLRFESTGIPVGAEITSAKLQLQTATPQIANPVDAPLEWAMNVNMELTANPPIYGTPALEDRPKTSQFLEWPSITAESGVTIESPDLTDIVQELVDLPDWTDTSSVSVVLNPSTNTLSTLQRAIQTSTGLYRPKLEVTWTLDNSIGDAVNQEIVAGLRFNYIHVPPGAQITSAYLRLNSHAASDEPTTLTIAAEKTANSPAFTAADFNLSQRVLTDARETWEVDSWNEVGTEYESDDISLLIQEVVDQSDWCGGNAVSLLISGSGLREVVSQEANSISSPRLEITYDPDTAPTVAYCSNRFRALSILNRNDDAKEMANGSVELGANTLQAAGQDRVGLRFREVGIPQGTQIKGANLQVTTATDYTGGDTLKISLENKVDAAAFTNTANDISSRDYLPSTINWSSLPALAAEESANSIEITTQLQSLIDQPGWNTSSSINLMLQATSGGSLPIYSFEGEEALSARLLVYYEGERTTPGTLARESLKAEVESLVPSGGTPIVESIYEAARYLRGLPVEYGNRRGRRRTADRFSRISHSESYTGGTVERRSSCTAQNLNDQSCRYERITGNPVYTSPINNRCQESHVVLLSDGRPTSMYAVPQTEALIGENCALPQGHDRACGVELAEWMNTNDHASHIPGEQKITLHTIAFNLSDPAFMEQLAQAGGGGSYSANTSAQLLNVFKNIFVNVSKSDTSFVAPAVAVDQFNRLKHRDEIFFSQFKPESTARWDGNLKKYKVEGNENGALTIIDSLGNAAINEASGQFESSSKSFWSNETDGGDVSRGGAASRLSLQTRNIYTYTGVVDDLTDEANEVSTNNPRLVIDYFDLPPETLSNTAYRNDLINWTAGRDSRDEDGDGDVTEFRQHMGDPMHSQPLVLDYASGGSTKSLVIIGTNEGYLHAVDALTGLEQYAFIPPELLRNMRRFFDNQAQTRRVYGIDGGLSAWVDDTNQNGLIDAGEKALLYIGMRRGGNNYYVLDVSNYDQPRLAYTISGGQNSEGLNAPFTAEGDYRELGQTWSRIAKTQLMDGDTPRDVIIFGGGYDTNQDPSESATEDSTDADEFGADGTRVIDSSGRAIFIADAETGDLLWTPSFNDPDYEDMLYSIPSDLRVIDINSDGMADQLYFGDMGGQVWRIDINNRSDITDGLSRRITGGKIAELADDTPEGGRRFYYPPDVAVINAYGRQQLSISIGSGWRAHPLQTHVLDRFYNLRIPDVFSAPVDSFGQIRYETLNESSGDLFDVTNNLGRDLSASSGWYIDLEGNGEKALSSSLTLDNRVIFTTYTPASNTEVCAAAVGIGSVYTVDVRNGDPVVDFDDATSGDDELLKGDRNKTLNNPGIAATPAVVFPQTGSATVLIGPETLDEIPINTFKRRTYWQEHLDENS